MSTYSIIYYFEINFPHPSSGVETLFCILLAKTVKTSLPFQVVSSSSLKEPPNEIESWIATEKAIPLVFWTSLNSDLRMSICDPHSKALTNNLKLISMVTSCQQIIPKKVVIWSLFLIWMVVAFIIRTCFLIWIGPHWFQNISKSAHDFPSNTWIYSFMGVPLLLTYATIFSDIGIETFQDTKHNQTPL